MSPTVAYPVLCFLSLVLLSVIGFGPSLYLVSQQRPHRVAKALLISPVVALAEIALITYPLFLNSVPLDQLTVPLTIILISFSLILFIADFRKHQDEFIALFLKSNGKYVAGFIVIFFLLVLPSYVGGDSYRYWQGNSYDATNYWSLTSFAQHIPVREMFNPAALPNAVQTNPALIMPLSGLGVRLVVELPVGWLSLLFNIPAYEFYYYYKLLALVITFIGALVVAKQLNLPPAYRFGLIIALTIGFWPWYVSDIDALSHIYSIPLGLLFLFAWLQLEEDAALILFSRQRFLFSLSLAALLGYYPEFVPLTVSGLVLFHIKLAIDHPVRSLIRRTPGILISIGIILLLVLPSLGKMVEDLLNQSSLATTEVSDNWASYFYSWLYTREMLTGRLWGLFYYSSNNPITLLAITLLTFILGIIALIGVLKSFLEKHVSTTTLIVSSLFVSFWGGALVIYILGRDWVAGKAFAMGYPFAFTALFVYAHQISSNLTVRAVARYLVAAALIIWSVSQFFVPVLRAANFAADQGYEGYVDVRSPIGDIVPVVNYLQQAPPELLVSYFLRKPRTIPVGWGMMLSDKFRHNTMGGLTQYYDETPVEYWQQIDQAPTHLLFDSQDNYFRFLGIGTPEPIESPTFQLYRVTPEELNETVFRSNILYEEHQQGFATASSTLMYNEPDPYRAVATNQEHIRFLAGSDIPIGISLALGADEAGSVSIHFNGTTLFDETSVQPNQVLHLSSCATMRPGSNDLVIDYSSVGDPAAFPLKIYRFRVASTDGVMTDIGEVNDGVYSAEGWYGRESDGQTSFRWASRLAQASFFTCEYEDYTLRFRAAPLSTISNQQLLIGVNGTTVEEIQLEDNLREYEITIPATALNSDNPQTITLEHAYERIPDGDSRSLSVLYDWIEIAAAE